MGESGSEVEVRRASPADAALIAAVHLESIETLGARGYPPEIVREWARPCRPERYVDAMAAGQVFFLAFPGGGDEPLGFSSYRREAGEDRVAVYVAGRAARRRVGTALYRVAEELARASGATEIHLDSSVVAEPFYLANGFEVLGRGEHRLRAGGTMPCVFMRKRL